MAAIVPVHPHSRVASRRRVLVLVSKADEIDECLSAVDVHYGCAPGDVTVVGVSRLPLTWWFAPLCDGMSPEVLLESLDVGAARVSCAAARRCPPTVNAEHLVSRGWIGSSVRRRLQPSHGFDVVVLPRRHPVVLWALRLLVLRRGRSPLRLAPGELSAIAVDSPRP